MMMVALVVAVAVLEAAASEMIPKTSIEQVYKL
jgi:hypothetical protein